MKKLSDSGKRYLARCCSYQRAGRNYRYHLGIRTGWDLPIKGPSETKQACARKMIWMSRYRLAAPRVPILL